MSNYSSSDLSSDHDSCVEPCSRQKRSPSTKKRATSQKRTPSQPQNSKSMREARGYKDQGTMFGSRSRRDSQEAGSSRGSHGRRSQAAQDRFRSHSEETPYTRFLMEFRERYGNYYQRDQVTAAAKRHWIDIATRHSEPPKNFFRGGVPNALNAKSSDNHGAAFSFAGIDIESGPASSKDVSIGSVDDGECCMKKKKPKMCKPKQKKKVCARKPKCAKPKPRCAKPKPKCRKPKRKNACRRAPACPKRKPRCPKPKPKCQKPKPACPRPC